MHLFTAATIESDRLTVTRRRFAGGMLATLAAATMALPTAAQGLKDVDDDRNEPDEDDSGDIPENWEEIGITSEFTYESPQFGYSIEWEEPWIVDPTQPGMTDPEMGLDDLTLKWDGAARQSISVSLVGLQSDPIGVEGFGDYMVSAEGKALWESGNTAVEERYYEADDTSFELLYALLDPEDETLQNWMFMAVAEVSPDAWLMATLVTSDEFLEDTYNGLSDLVLVNGDSLIRLSAWRDIERAIG